MKKNLLYTILLLLSFYECYTQEPTPAVEWAEPYSGGTKGGSISIFNGSNALFALIKGQNSISGVASISKFNAAGLIKDQFIYAGGGSSNAPAISQYASHDGGVLVYILLGSILRKYNDSLNLSWEKTINYSVQNATPTSANGFYLLTKRTVSDSTVSEIKKIKNDGTEEWTVAITTGFDDGVNDIATSSDDGVIIATKNGLQKYSSAGALVWSNATILGGYRLALSDNSSFYLLATNTLTSTRSVIQMNASTGSANWTKSLVGESIYYFERTSDGGCVFSTNTGLYKYNSTGTLQWKNTDYNSAKIAVSGDQQIFLIKNNSVFKLTFANELVWSKNFNSTYYVINDIIDAPDYGLYIAATKNGANENNAPDFLIFKLASPASPCKTAFEITGQNTISCKVGNTAMTSNFGKVSLEYMSFLTDFSFQWYKNNIPIPSATSHAYSATQSGIYHLTVKQQNCVLASRTVELTIVNEIPPTVVTEASQICYGNSVSLHASGCTGTVVWSNGARGASVLVNPLITTSYTAVCEKMMNNEPCQSFASNSITVTVLPFSNLRITEISGKKEFCEQDSTELEPVIMGGLPPFSYIWARNSTNISNEPKLPVNQDGSYVLHVFDSIGCYFRSDSIAVKKRAKPAVPVINQPVNAIICYGDSLQLSTVTTEKSYQWFLNNQEIAGAVNQSFAATSAGTYKVKVINDFNCSNTSLTPLVVNASTLRITEISGKKEFCEQSSTVLVPVVSGGSSPFTYSWTKNSTSLANTPTLSVNQEGKYVLQVFDNIGCSFKSDSIWVRKNALPAIPSINQPLHPVICNEENVVLSTDAQETSYQWLLNNNEITGATNAAYTVDTPGSYQLKVTNAYNCSAFSERPIVITVSNLKITGISGRNTLCEGSSTQLNGIISGGITPLAFQWTKNSVQISSEPTVLINDEGKYVLAVSDNAGCIIRSDTLAVKKLSNPEAPIIELSSGDTQICVGGSAILTTSSIENAYQWLMNNTEINKANSQSYTATHAGEYRLKITNAGGCSASSINTITINEVVIPQPTITQSNDTLISSASGVNKWYFNGTELSSGGQKIKFAEVGSYQVKVLDKGCESPISVIFLPVLLANEEQTFLMQLYPNPTSDKVYLKSARLFTYKIIDVNGRLMDSTTVKQSAYTIDFSGFSSGNYFIVLETENGNIIVKKVNVSR